MARVEPRLLRTISEMVLFLPVDRSKYLPVRLATFYMQVSILADVAVIRLQSVLARHVSDYLKYCFPVPLQEVEGGLCSAYR